MNSSSCNTIKKNNNVLLPYQKPEEMYIEKLSDVQAPWYFIVFKRLFDIVFSLLALIVTFIPSVLIAIIIKLTSPGPVLFFQERLGKGGKPFHIIKFRTMCVDAEKNGAMWSIGEDTRVTSIGKILRKTRLDEIPQFINILTSKMSLIGPRPEREVFYREFEKFIHGFSERLKVKPGLTGYAQVYGGYQIKPEEKILFDIDYIKNRSLWLDCRIFFKTVLVFFTGEKSKGFRKKR